MAQARELPPNFFSLEWGGVEAPHELMFAPARSILPFLRYPLGYDMVHPKRMVPIALFMIAAPPFGWALYGILLNSAGRRIPADTGHIYLIGFALLMLAISIVLFACRWLGLRRGEKTHSQETGYSWLAYHTRLPVSLCETLIVPGVIVAMGWIIDDTFSINLGRWLILSGCSLAGLAHWEGRRTWSQRRSAIDEEKRLVVYQRGFKAQATSSASAPDIAELGQGLTRVPRAVAPCATGSHQQRGNISAPARSSNPAPQDGDDALF